MRSSMGHGRVRAADDDCFFGSLGAWNGGVQGVLYAHGANQPGLNCRSSSFAGQFALANALGALYACASTDVGGGAGGGALWGNDTAIAAVGGDRTWIQGTWGAKSGKVVLVGASMGVCTLLNYARANPANVACVVGIIPIIDLNDVVTNNRGGFAGSVNTAYGGAYSEATHGPTHNPANYAASLSVPVKLWYSTGDAVAVPAPVTAFAAACPTATAVASSTQPHGEQAILDAPISDVLAFIAAHV